MNKTTQTLDKVDIVQVMCRQYGGMKILDDSEVKPDAEKVSTKGSKWVIDPETLKPFMKLRSEYRRLMSREGVSFMGGYAIPKDKTDTVLKKMEIIKSQYDCEVQDFLFKYPANVESWARQKPSWSASIRKDAPTVEKVAKSFKLLYQSYAVNPTVADNAGTLLEEEATGLPYQVAKEVAQDMKDSFDGSKGVVTQRVRGLLIRARDKFRSFGFLDPSLEAAAKQLDSALAAMPQTGPIQGTDFLVLAGLVATLTQPKKVLQGTLDTVIPDSGQMEVFADTEANAEVEAEIAPAAEVAPPPVNDKPILSMNW